MKVPDAEPVFAPIFGASFAPVADTTNFVIEVLACAGDQAPTASRVAIKANRTFFIVSLLF